MTDDTTTSPADDTAGAAAPATPDVPTPAPAAPTTVPGETWQRLLEGNERFVRGTPAHPHQDSDRRSSLAGGQKPVAALFGCADSRLAAEIIFDAGLGDLFVVRNAGQVVGDTALASLEYAVSVLDVPLVVVLGHDSCGAVATAIDVIEGGAPTGSRYLQGLVDMITPSVRRARIERGALDDLDPRDVGRLHIHASVAALVERSGLLSAAVAEGRLAVVGANYDLGAGRVETSTVLGRL